MRETVAQGGRIMGFGHAVYRTEDPRCVLLREIALGLGGELPALAAQLSTVDSALAFARREFNQAVTAYNVALGEQPTVWLARLVGFRAAGVL